MDAKLYTEKSIEIINQLDLDEYQKKLIEQNWLNFIFYLESRIQKNYSRYKLYTTLGIVGGIVIPAVSSLEMLGGGYDKILVSIIGVLTACSIGINSTYKFNEKWRHFRLIVEIARIEGLSRQAS